MNMGVFGRLKHVTLSEREPSPLGHICLQLAGQHLGSKRKRCNLENCQWIKIGEYGALGNNITGCL